MDAVAPVVLALCIGAVLPPALYCRRSGGRSQRLLAKQGAFAVPIMNFLLIFSFLPRMNRNGDSIGTALETRKNRRSADIYAPCFTNCYITRLLISLYGAETEICWIWDNGKLKNLNNAQRHSPRPIPNHWCCFRPTLVFAGHYCPFKLIQETISIN
jgi:hypothetical protein